MISVKNDFSDRVDEIDKYYYLLFNILKKESQLVFPSEDNRMESFDVTLTATLKSNMFLLLYNLVESTITKCLIEIHNSICDENCTYVQLSPQIQNLFTNHYYKSLINGNISEENTLLHIRTMIHSWVFNEKFSLTFEDLTKYKTGSNFSGNLDAKEIRKIATKYGVTFDLKSEEIKILKEYRNKLAHGEISFQDASKLRSIEYFENLKTKTINFLNHFITAVDTYVNQKEFKTTTIQK
ncbi:MAE_28990/MAE_18760 family HEPN-like nuclease [Elizabethkingia anophelis]|uniref:MAE_28990/MAE_18760 family HEPN-like nuclease n=1 Tax=Elizabethkingia anophelis TaxID=1117645 RepID=UPI003891A3A4